MSTITELNEFGQRELKMLELLLKAYREQGLPKDFDSEGLVPMINKESRSVFLTNADYDVALMNGDKLEKWHTCYYCGHEGFLEDFEHEPTDQECHEAMQNAGLEGHSHE